MIDTQLATAARLLRDASPDLTPSDLKAATEEGIAGILATRQRGRGAAAGAQDLIHAQANAALHHRIQVQALERVIPVLDERAIKAIVFKGAALSHQIYAAGERPHCDIDLWVPETDRGAAIAALEELGFTRNLSVAGGELMHQLLFRAWVGGTVQRIDLHWRFSNRPLLNNALPFATVYPQCEMIRISDDLTVRVPDPHWALILACAHLRGHHWDESPRLIWLVDIQRLWPCCTAETLVRRATATGLSALVAAGIRDSMHLLGRFAPDRLVERLEQQGATEPAAEMLQRSTRLGHSLLDLAALPDWRRKLTYLRDIAVPPAAYMRERYGLRSNWQLPGAHLKRVIGGLRSARHKDSH